MDELIPSTIIVLLEPVQIEPETYYHIFMTGVLCFQSKWMGFVPQTGHKTGSIKNSVLWCFSLMYWQ